MEDDLYTQLETCTVRVTTNAKRGHGTGFFVAPGVVLTCAHVLPTAAVAKKTAIAVYHRGKDLDAILDIVTSREYPDLAYLRTSFHDHPCVLLDHDVTPSDQLYTFGYSDDYPEGDSATVSCEGWSGIEHDLLKLKAGQIRLGMSGSPLLNTRTGAVCAIVKRSRGKATTKGGRAIPIMAAFDVYGELSEVQERYHAESGIWRRCQVALTTSTETRGTSVHFVLYAQGRSDVASVMPELLTRANTLLGRPSSYQANFDHYDLGNHEQLQITLSEAGSMVVCVIADRLPEDDFKQIQSHIQDVHTLVDGRLLLLFKRGVADIHLIDTDHLARIKAVRELAERAGVPFFDYQTLTQCRQMLYAWVCNSLGFGSEGARKKLQPSLRRKKVKTKSRRPCFCTLVVDPVRYISRSEPERLVRSALSTSKSERHSIIAVTGHGGTGKTTLCKQVALEVFRKSTSYQGLFWYSFNEEGLTGSTTFMKALLSYVGLAESSEKWESEPHRCRQELLDRLTENCYLLVLDGLEDIQHSDSRDPRYGEIASRVLRDFLVGALGVEGSTILLTSRISPTDVSYASQCATVALPCYTKKEALQLLSESALKGSEGEFSVIAEHYAYHPLSLSLVARYVERVHLGSVHDFIQGLSTGEVMPLSERLSRILSDYWLQLQDIQKELLTALAVLGRPLSAADAERIACMLYNNTTVEQLIGEMNALCELGFTQRTCIEDAPAVFSVHPLIKSLIKNSLASEEMHRKMALAWAFVESESAREATEDSIAQLEARAREVHFLMDAGRIGEAVDEFVENRLNVRIFERGMHDVGIPLGERIFALTTSGKVERPTADYLSGYLPDHYACSGRIRSAVRIMKDIPVDDNWTALCDQIWILLRGGEIDAAKDVVSRAPEWRRDRGGVSWVLGQLRYYEGSEECVGLLSKAQEELQQLLKSYRVRLQTQYARALYAFGHPKDARCVLDKVPRLSLKTGLLYPAEQIHADVAMASIYCDAGDLQNAAVLVDTAVEVARNIGDDYGLVVALLAKVRLALGIPKDLSRISGVADGNVLDDLRLLNRLLRVSSEGEVDFGLPVEACEFNLIMAMNTALGRDIQGTMHYLNRGISLADCTKCPWCSQGAGNATSVCEDLLRETNAS